MIERADSTFGVGGTADRNEASVESAGTQLRRAREAAGLHIAALAVSLKVPVAKLEALEADRVDLLPDAVFTRALASSVCRTLKLDPAPVLAQLPQQALRLGEFDQGINTPFRSASAAVGPGVAGRLLKPWSLAVAVLLLGAVALYFSPRMWPDLADWWQSRQSVSLAASASVQAPRTATALVAEVPGGNLPVVTAAPTSSSPSAYAAGGQPSAVEPRAPEVAATATANTPVASSLLSFSARAASWVKVTDAARTVVFEKMLQAGESASAGGTPPLAVVIGRADATDVMVRGKPFDLSLHARDNVARFDVR